jgi:hypothetical protein
MKKGPRHNSVFEGLSFDEDYRHLYVSVEEPLYEDGHRAAGGDSTAFVRILKFNRRLKQCVAQFAYRVDAVRQQANPPEAFKINGISEILYLGNEKLLVIERAFSTGTLATDIRIYLVDLKEGRFIDNFEGVTFGPPLSNGHRTLIFVSDDNFAPAQKTQFFLFEVLP